MPADPCQDRDQRRLIHVSGSKVFGASQVIKGVSEIAVSCRCEQVEGEVKESDHPDKW